MFAEGGLRTIVDDDEAGGLRLTIPAPRQWVVVLFLLVWLCFWAVGEFTVAASFIPAALAGHFLAKGNPLIILLVWLPFWTVAGAWTMLVVLWNLIGREVVTFGGEGIELAVQVGWFRRSRWFDLDEARYLRFSPGAEALNSGLHPVPSHLFRPGACGSVAFDVLERTYRFGYGLSEHEARRVIATIERRFKIPGPSKAEPLL